MKAGRFLSNRDEAVERTRLDAQSTENGYGIIFGQKPTYQLAKGISDETSYVFLSFMFMFWFSNSPLLHADLIGRGLFL